MTGGFPFTVSAGHREALARQARAERDEILQAETAADEWMARCQTYAHVICEANELMLAQQALEVHRAEAAERQRIERQQAETEDRMTALVMAGHRPHTVAEVLAVAAGIAR
jgi:hypothetical protein